MADNAKPLASPRSYPHARPEAISKTRARSPQVAEPCRRMHANTLSGTVAALVGWQDGSRLTRCPQAELSVA